jgi:hypothetical protein
MSLRPRKVLPRLVVSSRARCTQIDCNGELSEPGKGFEWDTALKLPDGGSTRRCEKCRTHVYLEPAA